MGKKPLFVEVTGENVGKLDAVALKDHGYFIMVSTAINWEISVSLYKRPTLRVGAKVWGGASLSSKYQGNNRRDSLNDREYRFGRSDRLKPLFARDRFSVNERYWLEIGPQWGGHHGFCFGSADHASYLVHKESGLRDALAHVFRNPITEITPSLTDEEIGRMLDYMFEDLRTKKAVRSAVQCGVDADMAFGLT